MLWIFQQFGSCKRCFAEAVFRPCEALKTQTERALVSFVLWKEREIHCSGKTEVERANKMIAYLVRLFCVRFCGLNFVFLVVFLAHASAFGALTTKRKKRTSQRKTSPITLHLPHKKFFQVPKTTLQPFAFFQCRVSNLGLSMLPVMAAVFVLCSVAHHKARLQDESGKRQRCSLPQHPFLLDKLEKNHLTLPAQRSNETPAFNLSGLMLCTPGIAVSDLLAQYPHRDELFIWQSFWRDLDGHTVVAKEVFRFDSPMPVFTCLKHTAEQPTPLRSRRHALTPFAPFGFSADDFWQREGTLLVGQTVLHTGFASLARARWGVDFSDILAISLLEPLASLLLKGQWFSTCIRSNWDLPRALFPGWGRLDLTGNVSAPVATQSKLLLDPAKFASLADRVRSWAPVLLQQCSDEDENAALRLDILDTVRFFDSGKRSLEWAGQQQEFSSKTLIDSVCLGAMLGSNKHVNEAVPMSAQIIFPNVDLRCLLANSKFPKSSTIGRAGSALDFAFLLHARKLWQEGAYFHFAWADSSPQAGREWFMMMHASVRKDAVVSACRAANTLTRARPDLSDHFEAEDIDLVERPVLHQTLLSAVFHHTCVPVALGSGKVSLEDKVSCLLHACGLECASLPALQSHLKDFVSWTTDLGTERQVPDFHVRSVAHVLPDYLHPRLECDVDTDSPEQQLEDSENSEALPIMPNALLTPGGLHITHNASKDLHQKLHWFDEFWSHLKSVAAMLVPQHMRDRIIARLVRGTAAAGHEAIFATMSLPPLYEKRWQVIVIFLTNFLPHFRLVKQVWDLQGFLIDGQDADGDAGASFDTALANPLFCSYIFMVHGVHSILSSLDGWLENCACHEHLFTQVSRNRQRKKRRQLFGGSRFADCPMRGKRSAELAAGKLEDTLSELSRAALNLFSGEVDYGLVEEDRAVLMKDFEFAKQHVHFILVAKFDFWQKIPWRLCGISHHWVSVARKVAKACIEDFDESMLQEGMLLEHHHPLTVRFLAAGRLREDLEAFVNGADMSNDLETAASALKFVPVVERVVEALHRDVKVATKHVRIGPTKVSLSVRLREIMGLMDGSEDFLARLEEHFDTTRRPKQAAAALGLLSHPGFKPLLEGGCVDVGQWLQQLVKVVHRCDLETQFADLKAARKQHTRKRKALDEQMVALHDAQALPIPRNYQDIFRRAIVDHFRGMADSSLFFALPARDEESASYQLLPLLSNAEKRARVEVARDQAADLDIVVGGEPGHGRVFFRLLHGAPSRLKSMPLPVATAPAFAKGSMAIAVHNGLMADGALPKIDLSTNHIPQLLSSLEKCSLEVLRNDFQVWSVSSDMQYSLPDMQDVDQASLVECVTSLLQARALPGGDPLPESSLPQNVLRSLFDSGFLIQCGNGAFDDSGVALSDLAISKVHVMCPLQNPQAVCSIQSRKLSDYDLMELMIALDQKDWIWKPLPNKNRDKLFFEPGQPLEWYSQSHCVNRAYLQCLLSADALFRQGVARIPHWTSKPVEVYPALLRGEQPVPINRPLALEPDLPIDEDLALGDREFSQAPIPNNDLEEEGGSENDRRIDELAALFSEDESQGEWGAGPAGSGVPAEFLEALEKDSFPYSPDEDPPAAPATPEFALTMEEAEAAAEAPVPDESASEEIVLEIGKPAAYGPFKLTAKQPSAKAGRTFGGIEASCPFHRKNKSTGCKKYLQLRSGDPDELSKCLRSLKMWCNSARLYDRQRDHLSHHITIDTAPADEVVSAGKITDGPAEKPKADDELDAVVGAEPKAKGKAKPKSRGKPKGRGEGAGRARGRGRASDGRAERPDFLSEFRCCMSKLFHDTSMPFFS